MKKRTKHEISPLDSTKKDRMKNETENAQSSKDLNKIFDYFYDKIELIRSNLGYLNSEHPYWSLTIHDDVIKGKKCSALLALCAGNS